MKITEVEPIYCMKAKWIGYMVFLLVKVVIYVCQGWLAFFC